MGRPDFAAMARGRPQPKSAPPVLAQSVMPPVNAQAPAPTIGRPDFAAMARSRPQPQQRVARTEPSIADPEQSASFMTNLAAGTMFPEQQVLYYASERFPNEPLEQAVKRYRLENGEVSYRGDDGQFYRESAGGTDAFAGMITDYAVPGLGGAGGAIAAAPGGPVAAAAGGAGGAAMADAAKRALGDALAPSNSSVLDKISSASSEGMLDLAGGAVGGFLVKGIKSPAFKELKKHAGEAPEKLMQVARDKFGIKLSWAEASNLKSLLGRQQMLNRSPTGADFLQKVYQKRMGDIAGAVEDFMGNVSPIGSAAEASYLAREAAENSVQAAHRQIQAKAKPLYDAAKTAVSSVDISDVAKLADDKANVLAGDAQRSMRQVKADLFRGDGELRSTVEEIHNSRKSIDGLIAQAEKGQVPGWTTQNIKELKAVRSTIDAKLKAIPEFAAADKFYANAVGEVKKVARSVIGDIARTEKPDISSISRKLFNAKGIDINAFQGARDRIRQQSPEAWDAIVRWHIENQWDTVTKSLRPGEVRDIGGRFASAVLPETTGVMGKQAKLMREALKHRPEVLQTLETLTDVLSATSRGIREGSPTQPLMMQEKEAVREAMWSSPALKVASAGKIASPEGIPRLIGGIENLMTGRYNKQFAEALFEPDFQKAMNYIRLVGPKTQQGVRAFTTYIGRFTDRVTGTSEGVRQQVTAGDGATASGVPEQ